MEPDLDRLLPLIDDEPFGDPVDVVEAEARVWARLSGEVALEPREPAGPTPSGWLLAAAAALVAVLVGALVVVVIGDSDERPADDVEVTTTRLDRDTACARFRSAAPAFDALDDDLEGPGAVESVQQTLDALDALIDGLLRNGTAELTDDDLEALQQVRGGLQQAALHLEQGDLASARAALEFGRRAYADSAVGASGCLG